MLDFILAVPGFLVEPIPMMTLLLSAIIPLMTSRLLIDQWTIFAIVESVHKPYDETVCYPAACVPRASHLPFAPDSNAPVSIPPMD